ncbi:MAG: hypothetical protein GYB20_10090 [Oceanospirillales bacterium]|nr:hypothetical protein [Oceanospirillales bacterium]MBR9888025.1 hypothetical protein [Oceanospirillales bacterium]
MRLRQRCPWIALDYEVGAAQEHVQLKKVVFNREGGVNASELIVLKVLPDPSEETFSSAEVVES